MAKKQDADYFEMFENMANYSHRAAQSLFEAFDGFYYQNLPSKLQSLHEIEHAADMQKHELMRRLTKEFLPPIERNDIITLASCLDDVTDTVEDVLIYIYMYNIKNLRSDAPAFAQIILQSCQTLAKAVSEFRHFKKSNEIQKTLIEINRLEEVGDALYIEAVHRLHSTETDPVRLLAWTEVYRGLELCCDACERAADVIEMVIMQNS